MTQFQYDGTDEEYMQSLRSAISSKQEHCYRLSMASPLEIGFTWTNGKYWSENGQWLFKLCYVATYTMVMVFTMVTV